ncbi:exonuclease recombination-associated [Vibrio phage douglas 12A4]|uniref:exonuclease recombination-associated n=1 Tax=Vibrio phage douglas 12A4 TaxID=573171 RepID=UPI0002C086B9|nr:exonuclease recombination-associated [Vibrio phage douglas 12A4]AGG58079.1 recombination-associated protein RdgC [Vibrio phage douglas 12A4]
MKFFNNALMYRFTKEMNIDALKLEEQLAEFRLTPCGPQDMQKFGWVNSFGIHGDMLTHVGNGAILISARKEEKIIPSSVIKNELDALVAAKELESGVTIKRAEKSALKDDLLIQLLPRAFSRFKTTEAVIIGEYIIVNASNYKQAEDLLALLRKSMGSLPVIPVVPKSDPSTIMTEWVKTSTTPNGFELGEQAELRSILDDGGVAKLKGQELACDETMAHIDANKVISKLSVSWQGRLSFLLDDSLAVKCLSFSDEIKDQNEDIGFEDKAARFDADFCLMVGELKALTKDLLNAFGGEEYEKA